MVTPGHKLKQNFLSELVPWAQSEDDTRVLILSAADRVELITTEGRPGEEVKLLPLCNLVGNLDRVIYQGVMYVGRI